MDFNEPTVMPSIVMSDYALRDAATNKSSLIGIFHHFTSDRFPLDCPTFYITAYIYNFRTTGEGSFAMRIEDANCHVLWSVGGKFDLQGIINEKTVVEPQVVVSGLRFAQAGKYSIIVMLNKETVGTRYFWVESITAAPKLT